MAMGTSLCLTRRRILSEYILNVFYTYFKLGFLIIMSIDTIRDTCQKKSKLRPRHRKIVVKIEMVPGDGTHLSILRKLSVL